MQLFLFLNSLAGRWPLLDEVARFFYIGALPALGTLLLAQLLILPRSGPSASRSKTALALVLALMLGALVAWGFDLVAGWLHLGNLSPRPWMTRRVNWLVVEPQDDSFPCVEMVLAAALACASWKLNFRLGLVSVVAVVVLGLTRLFCGNNYFADVLVGGAVGASSFVLCWQMCQRYMAFGRRAREFCLSASPLMVTLVGCYFFALLSPRFEGKLGIERPAAASTAPMVLGAKTMAASVPQGEGEGEGMESDEGRAEELALAKRSTLFLPQLEAFLRGKLTPIARPFPLLDVEAAPVKAGTTSYRCAAIRFEVPAEQPNMRRMVADRAARLVQTAFALDSQLQNVDVVAVARDEGRNLDKSLMIFAGDEVPVFTASVQRKNLGVVLPVPVGTAVPAGTSVPGATPIPVVDGMSWLRARSLLYINDRALPDSSTSATPSSGGVPHTSSTGATPLPTATVSGAHTPTKMPARTPVAPLTPRPVTPRASVSPAPSASPRPAATATATARPTIAVHATPHATVAVKTQQRATPSATPVLRKTSAPVAQVKGARPTVTLTPTRASAPFATAKTPRPPATHPTPGATIHP